MQKLVANFSNQLREAVVIGSATNFQTPKTPLHNVVIAGLGGSGIGGDIVREITSLNCKLPVVVTKGYFVPDFVNDNTLFIASSYSGNTEETLQALEMAIERKAKIVCITSGGKVLALAQQHQLDHVVIPGGFPPRSCLGYSITQLLFIFKFFGLINMDVAQDIAAAADLLDQEEENIHQLGHAITASLKGKSPIIYSTTYFEAVAIRFRQQLNENAKMLCWHNVIPEMNHNELVGWRSKNDDLAVILFRDPNEYSRNDLRIEINKNVIKNYTSTFIEIMAKGKNHLEKAMYLIHIGDWISCYLADQRGFNATEIDVINNLKSALSKA